MEGRPTAVRRQLWGRAEREAGVALGLGAAVAVGVTLTPLSWVAGVLVGWDCVALAYTGRLAVVLRRWDAARTRSRAMSTDLDRFTADVALLGAAVASLVAVGALLTRGTPGTVEQIKSVIKIAAEVPTKDVIVHIEGGRAGGHHSWEDLDDLLLTTYGELRKHRNITVCVGGGIGTPERAAEYLSGTAGLHANVGETSAVLAIDPALVDMERVGIKLDTEPACIATNTFANDGRVLTDAAREYDRVEASECSHQRTELAPDAITIKINR